MDDIKVLLQFLNMPLGNTGAIFAKFGELDGAEHRGVGKRQFVYRPGERDDRVLLVAHADTVWNGGLGADDRAGCAIAWLLKDLGHSLLIVDGEETGRQGSHWLMEANDDIGDEINDKHNFVIEFDRRNGTDYKCYDVGTREFRKYIEAMTSYAESDRHSYTDIGTLCRKVPGANLSVGYRNEHTEKEYLVVKEWQHTLDMSRKWLGVTGLPGFKLLNELT
jgi:hypothetical protein